MWIRHPRTGIHNPEGAELCLTLSFHFDERNHPNNPEGVELCLTAGERALASVTRGQSQLYNSSPKGANNACQALYATNTVSYPQTMHDRKSLSALCYRLMFAPFGDDCRCVVYPRVTLAQGLAHPRLSIVRRLRRRLAGASCIGLRRRVPLPTRFVSDPK